MHSGLIRFCVRRVLLGGLVAVTAAQAQAQVGPQAGLEEIIVTARKVAENLQETPIAITAFSGEALTERQIFNTAELDQVVPNLQFANNAPLAGNNSSSQIFIRGIGQTDPTSTVDPGVGLYIDDVYIGSAVGGSMTLRDIANVQVLRGPQGTLFGRNTIGGAIIMTTTDPGDEFGGSARLGLGSDSLVDGFLALDVPISETFKSRFTIGYRNQDGYVERTDGTDLGDTDTYTATAKFVWSPGDRFTGKLLFDYTSSDENGSPLVFATYNEAASFGRVASLDAGCPGLSDLAPPPFLPEQNVPLIADDRCANDLQSRGEYRTNGTAALTSQLDNYGTSLNLVFGLTEAIDLKSITSYRNLDWEGNRDADNTPLPILHTFYDVDSWQMSEEIQLLYEGDPLTGVFGVYYFKQKSDDIVTIVLNPPVPPAGPNLDSDNNKVDNESWAVFTQWTYRFAAERLGVTVGGRYTEDEKGSYPDQFDYSTPTVKQVPVQWYRDTFSDFTPSGSIDYRFLGSGDGVRELLGGLQGRWMEQPLQPAATAAGLPGAGAGVRAREGQDVRARVQGGSCRQYVPSERGSLLDGLRGPAGHLSRAIAERRRAVSHQRGQGERRRCGARGDLGAELCPGRRGERWLPGFQSRRAGYQPGGRSAARAGGGQRAAVRSGMAGACRYRLRRERRWVRHHAAYRRGVPGCHLFRRDQHP